MEGFLHHEFGVLIFGGASTWRGLFSEIYGIFGVGKQIQLVVRVGLDPSDCKSSTLLGHTTSQRGT